ncbi:MAG: hypothetical protein H6Q90_6115 [Deltaproteobacteria bacterium]|nr:hypothetical protein [Deltaproteobacteria bacterium]
MRRSLALVLLIVAPASSLTCGGSPDVQPRPVGPPAALVAAASGPDDLVVAQVAGRPVWSSCVAAQARRDTTQRPVEDKRTAALRECIDFELLAQAAEARGLASDPEVINAARTALVSRVVETGFEDLYRTPADLRAQIDATIAANQRAMLRAERRLSTFARVELAKDASPETEAAAHALADQIHDALAARSGLFARDLHELVDARAKTTKLPLKVFDFKLSARNEFEDVFGDALFALEVGRISPPTRTPQGWDVILLTELVPSKQYTREEVETIVFPELRRKQFLAWASQLVQSLGIEIEEIQRDDFARVMAETQ